MQERTRWPLSPSFAVLTDLPSEWAQTQTELSSADADNLSFLGSNSLFFWNLPAGTFPTFTEEEIKEFANVGGLRALGLFGTAIIRPHSHRQALLGVGKGTAIRGRDLNMKRSFLHSKVDDREQISLGFLGAL